MKRKFNLKGDYKKWKGRVLVLIGIVICTLVWTLINADGFILPAFMYMVLGVITIVGYLIFDKFGGKGQIFGVDNNILFDIGIGIGFAVLFILLQSFNIIGSILIPYIPASLVQDYGRFFIVCLGAGIIESAFFIGLLIPAIQFKLDDWGIRVPFIIALIIVSILFPLYHLTAYGQNNAQLGSYISAGIFLFMSGYMTKWTKSLIPAILSHIIINFWILNLQTHWISFGVIGV